MSNQETVLVALLYVPGLSNYKKKNEPIRETLVIAEAIVKGKFSNFTNEQMEKRNVWIKKCKSQVNLDLNKWG